MSRGPELFYAPRGPRRDAAGFARTALGLCSGFIALLLTAKFDSGKTRTDLFADNPRFAAKIVLLDRIQWFAGDHGGTEDHAWYCWNPIGRINAVRGHLIYEGKNQGELPGCDT